MSPSLSFSPSVILSNFYLFLSILFFYFSFDGISAVDEARTRTNLQANCVTLSEHRKIGRVKRACLHGIFKRSRKKAKKREKESKKQEEEAFERFKIGQSASVVSTPQGCN